MDGRKMINRDDMAHSIKLAPIVLFVYNRLEHTKQTVEALQKNELAGESVLYIFSDGAKKGTNDPDIEKLRKYLYTIDGFKKVHIIERKENYGLAKNIIEGVTEIINEYGKVIVLEDDLLTSQNFLSFMNKALDFYKDDNRIFSISGYTGKLKSLEYLKEDVYLSYRPSSWGWATWKNQWDGIDWNVADFDEFIRDRQAVKKLNRGGIDMARMLRHCMQGKNHSWAIRWSYAMSKQDKYCVYPKVSKIQNIGFGDDATNCKGINIYQTDTDNTNKTDFHFLETITVDEKIAKDFRYQFSYRNKLIKRIRNFLSMGSK
jgi:hypothetical protein